MYKQIYPQVEDVVMVKVNKIEDIGVYVSLLEYNDIEGIILLKNISRSVRLRNIGKFIRVDQQMPMEVLSVDEEKGYIYLNLKFLSLEEKTKCAEKYMRSKKVHEIFKRISVVTDTPLVELYEKTGWPLYRVYSHCYNAFQLIFEDNNLLDKYCKDNLIKDEIIKIINQKFVTKSITITMLLNVTCYSYSGILGIQKSLRKGYEKAGEMGVNIKICLVATPLYEVSLETKEPSKSVEWLKQISEAISAEIIKEGGECIIKKIYGCGEWSNKIRYP